MNAGRRRHRHARATVAAALLLFCGAVCGSTAPAQANDARLIKIPNTSLQPVAWSELDGWADDDHAAGFAAFQKSCNAILKAKPTARANRPVFAALHEACRHAAAAKPKDDAAARTFFEKNFRPVRIAPLGETDGFLTGYYEPIVDGALEPSEAFSSPMYRKPPNLLGGGRMLMAATFTGKKGKRARKHKLVPYHDRAAIEDGVLANKRLEICYLKDPVDAFFSHIQGSLRVRLADGKMLRLNYDSQNGQAYTPVGRFLIERKLVTREEMSMDRIRQWMNANPDEGKELRRLNKSYVFFRETGLADDEEAIGAQGISLTPGRSIAVDRNIHVYGTPFFIQAELPIDSEQSTTKFRRLMVAQDTGGAIKGPARADLYWGAGDQAGLISGRIKNPGRFTMLFPNAIDPVAATADTPLPRPRPAIVEAKAEAPAAKPAEPKAETKPSAKVDPPKRKRRR